MEEFRNQLIEAINSAQLPTEAVYYIVKDVFRDVQESYDMYLARKQKEKGEEKDVAEAPAAKEE